MVSRCIAQGSKAFWTPPSRKRCRDSSVNPFVNKLRPRDEGGRGASMEENSDSLAYEHLLK